MNEQAHKEKDGSNPVAARPMYHQARMAVIDDDPIVAKVISAHLKASFPGIHVDTFHEPTVELGYDVYFLDNDFNGNQAGLALLSTVRKVAPHALVVALSNTLDLDLIKEMMNVGCNAVYDKRSPHRSEKAREVIRNYLSVVEHNRSRNQPVRWTDVFHGLRRLLGEWNHRLSQSEN